MTFALDKMQIDDALGVNTYQLPAGQPNPGAQFGAPAMGPPQQAPQPMAGRFGGIAPNMGAQIGPGHLQAGATLSPSFGFQGAQAGYSVPAMGGQLDINASVNPLFKLAQLGAKYSRGPFSATGTFTPGQGAGGGVQYASGPLTASAGMDPRMGAYGRLGVVQRFQEGGLATSLPVTKDYHQSDVDFLNTRNQQMSELVGKQAYAKGGAKGYAKGGGVWTRKEGQNPEGGLNAKGLGKPKSLSAKQKSAAKARAEAAGRPYPNLIDNMAVAKQKGK